MNDPQPISPRQRLQELLAIPERQRTDAEWDELNELEITLTPVNREKAPEQAARRPATAPSDRPKPGGSERGGERGRKPAERDRKPARKFHKRPPKADAP